MQKNIGQVPFSSPAANEAGSQNNSSKRNHKILHKHGECSLRVQSLNSQPVYKIHKWLVVHTNIRKNTDYTSLKSMISTKISWTETKNAPTVKLKKLQAPTHRASARSESAFLTDEGATHVRTVGRFPRTTHRRRRRRDTKWQQHALTQFNFHLCTKYICCNYLWHKHQCRSHLYRDAARDNCFKFV